MNDILNITKEFQENKIEDENIEDEKRKNLFTNTSNWSSSNED